MTELKNNKTTTTQPGLSERAAFQIGFWTLLGHLIGVSVVGGLIALPFVSANTIRVMWDVTKISGVNVSIGIEGLLHLGISACVWAMLVILFYALRPDPTHAPRRFRATRGTVLTETLIVMPVALLLTFGLAQLAVMNVAGILSNLASVQAARAAWLWYPEAESNRQNVSQADVKEMARIQAALILAPAAPGDFSLSGSEGSATFKKMRGSLIGAQMANPSSDAGLMGMTRALDLATTDGDADTERVFSRALDGSMFGQRAARKFTFAYLATSIDVLSSGDQVGVEMTYKQLCAFPVVSRIFGEPDLVGSRKGRYSEIKREFTLRKQLESNEKMPRQ